VIKNKATDIMTDPMSLLPQDPVMLMSYINTKLRDVYHSLDALCDDMHIQRPELESRLAEAGFTYDPDVNKFW